MEDLRVLQGVGLLVDEKVAGDKDNDVAIRGTGLGIESVDAVDDLLKGKADELLHNAGGTLVLRALEGEHRGISLGKS